MSKPTDDAPSVLPRRFPPLLALLAAGLVGGGLYLAADRGLLPPSLGEGPARWMIALHVLTVFALAVLIGERAALIPWAAALREHPPSRQLDGSSPDWVERAYDLSLNDLPKTPSTAERKAAIVKVRESLERALLKRWRIPWDLALILPVVGLLLMLNNLHLAPLAKNWSDVGLSFTVSVVEAIVVALLARWTSREGRSILSDWEDKAVEIARVRRLQGMLPEYEDELEVEHEVDPRHGRLVEDFEPEPIPAPDFVPAPRPGPTPPPVPQDAAKKPRDRSGKGMYNK